jgi:hypothetical protein
VSWQLRLAAPDPFAKKQPGCEQNESPLRKTEGGALTPKKLTAES